MAKVQGIRCATLACSSYSVWWYLVFFIIVDCEQQQAEVRGGEREAEMESNKSKQQAREAIVAWGAAGSAGGAQSNETVVLALGGFEKNQVGCCAKR